jgi:hypothetical protein
MPLALFVFFVLFVVKVFPNKFHQAREIDLELKAELRKDNWDDLDLLFIPIIPIHQKPAGSPNHPEEATTCRSSERPS